MARLFKETILVFLMYCLSTTGSDSDQAVIQNRNLPNTTSMSTTVTCTASDTKFVSMRMMFGNK